MRVIKGSVLGVGLIVAVSGAAWAGVLPGGAGDPEVQRVEIEATARGFVPAEVELVAGVPAELVFTRTTASGCSASVQIAELDVKPTPLPQGEPVTIAITVEKPGTYIFACGMNMLKGKLVVRAP